MYNIWGTNMKIVKLKNKSGREYTRHILECEYCKEEFLTQPYRKRIFCSDACARNNSRKTVYVQCANCGKDKAINQSKLKKSKHGIYFCDRKCKAIGQRITSGLVEIQPHHYGAGQRNYRTKAFENLEHKCNRCKYSDIVEILEVHHKDCNRSNNQLSNLEILCPTCHVAEHYKSKTGKFANKE